MLKAFFISVVVLIIVLTWLTERNWSTKKRLKWNKRKKRYQ